ncbi:uncharacterized protein LOC129972680 isoform X2 [Argiope bruennichi]|uniref:Uncharacterized protein n=1 Tax=Argiope bruennichi TaxID=94029 RepID=A0A8T0F8K4_ARGBR|nr:uncharacterized protein LOC129972680 isoform X2 [Argiope bruennichi]KAF8787536.1 hypothetical protein HNY73_009119 [Argiope bruennichi]
MHLKFTIAVLSLFVVLKLTKTKYISKSTDDVYNERSEILTSAAADEAESTSEPFSDDPTSTKSNGIIEPEISWKDYFKNLNKTNGEADESKGFWPFFPYIVFAVVVLGLVFRCFYKDKSAFSGGQVRTTSKRKFQFY